MKTMLIATAFALATSAAVSAEDFDNTTATVSAEWDRFTFEIKVSEDDGYVTAKIGAEVLSYGLGENVDSTLDVYAIHYHADDEFGVGAEYTVTYAPNAWSVYGAADVEYFVDAEVFYVTPTIGTAYTISEVTTVWGEVGYTWDATIDWTRQGGVAEVGVDFDFATNITLTPSVVYNFDQASGADDEAQLNLGVNLKF